MKRFSVCGVVLFIFGIICGSLFANLYYVENVSRLGVFDFEYIEKMQQMCIEWKTLFRYILWQRMEVWLFCLLLSCTCFGGVALWGCILFAGSLWGFEASCFVMVHGVKGLFYFMVVCLVAQGIAVLALLCSMQNARGNHRKRFSQIGWVIVLPFILLVLCSLWETVANLAFLKLL